MKLNRTTVAKGNFFTATGGGSFSFSTEWDAVVAVCVHFDCCVNCLKQALFVNADDEKTTFVEGLGALGAGADADCRERVADGGEET